MGPSKMLGSLQSLLLVMMRNQFFFSKKGPGLTVEVLLCFQPSPDLFLAQHPLGAPKFLGSHLSPELWSKYLSTREKVRDKYHGGRGKCSVKADELFSS